MDFVPNHNQTLLFQSSTFTCISPRMIVVVDRHYHSWEMHNQCGSRCHNSVGERYLQYMKYLTCVVSCMATMRWK